MPDLSAEAGADDVEAPAAKGPPGPPGAPAPTSAIDRDLVALAARVDRRLRRHPTTLWARRRAAKRGERGGLAARNGEVFPADNPVSLFRASAKTARRRRVTRPPG